jgi:hypothetical protein
MDKRKRMSEWTRFREWCPRQNWRTAAGNSETGWRLWPSAAGRRHRRRRTAGRAIGDIRGWPTLETEGAEAVEEREQAGVERTAAGEDDPERAGAQVEIGLIFRPFLERAGEFGVPGGQRGGAGSGAGTGAVEVLGAFGGFREFERAALGGGDGFGDGIATEGEVAGEDRLAVNHDHQDGSGGAQVDQDHSIGLGFTGEVRGGQTVGGGGDFAEIEAGKAATSDLTLDFLFAAEGDPEGVAVASVRLERGVIVDDVAFAQSAEFDRFGFDELTDLLRFGIGQVDGLGEGAVMRDGQGDGILAEILDDVLGMAEDFLFESRPALWVSINSWRMICGRLRVSSTTRSLTQLPPGSMARRRFRGRNGRRSAIWVKDASTVLSTLLRLVNDELAGLRQNRGGDEDEEIARSVDFAAAPEERADEGDIAQNRDRLDIGALLAFEHTAHDDRLAGADDDPGGQFLGAGLGQFDVERADDIAGGVDVAQGGERDELDVLADSGIQSQRDALAIAADAGEDVEFDAGGQFGGFTRGHKRGGGAAFGDGGFDGVFLVVVLDLAVADGGGAVIDHGEPGSAEGLAFAALFQGAEGGAEGGTAEDVGEGFLETEPDARNQAGGHQAGEIRGRPRGGELPAGFPKDAELEEGGLGNGDEPGFDEDLLDWLIEFLDDLFDDLELLAGAAGDDEVAFIVDQERGTREQFLDGLLDRRGFGGAVVDEFVDLLGFGDGGHVVGGGADLDQFGGAILGREDEAFAEPVEAGFLLDLGLVLGVDDPDQILTDLELEIVVARHEIEEFANPDAVGVEAELLGEGGEGFIGDEIDAFGRTDIEDERFERDVVQVHRDFLVEDLGHAPLGLEKSKSGPLW